VAASDNNKEFVHIKPKEQFNFFHDERVHSVFYQLLIVAAVGWFVWYLSSNTAFKKYCKNILRLHIFTYCRKPFRIGGSQKKFPEYGI
jgi:ABC-type amino acid transport system permease subunit